MPTATETATTVRLWLPLKSTRVRVRRPLAATVPNITRPAPPSTGAGTAATTAPSLGSRPSTTRMPPAVATTQRLRTRVMPTRPTFWAYAVYGKVLKTPPSTVDRPSARRPSERERGSTLRSVISPTAIRSPVVSVIVTRATTSIDTIAEDSKVGAPKWNGVLIPTQSASPTPSKSVNPKGTATAR